VPEPPSAPPPAVPGFKRVVEISARFDDPTLGQPDSELAIAMMVQAHRKLFAEQFRVPRLHTSMTMRWEPADAPRSQPDDTH
jgi:hypothetical protein